MKFVRTGYKTAAYEFIDELLWLSQPIAGSAFARLFELTTPMLIISNLIIFALMLVYFAAILLINIFLFPFSYRTRVISAMRIQIKTEMELMKLRAEIQEIFDKASGESTKPD